MLRMSATRLSLGLLASLGLFLAVSCKKKEEAAAPAPAPTSAPAAAPATAPSSAPSPAAEAAPPAAAPSAGAMASADGETSGRRVEVTELKRLSGRTLSLKFTLINDTDNNLAFHNDYGEKGQDYGSIGGVTLVDPVGKKKYMVMRDSDEKCLCSRDLPNVEKRSRLNLWAKFSAPPEDVKKISIVIPHFSPMDDVPIGQ
jgi:hypothetical protein